MFRTLLYLEPLHIQNQRVIQNPGILRAQAYSKPCQTPTMEHFAKINKKHRGQKCQGSGVMNFDISFIIKSFFTNVKTRHLTYVSQLFKMICFFTFIIASVIKLSCKYLQRVLTKRPVLN